MKETEIIKGLLKAVKELDKLDNSLERVNVTYYSNARVAIREARQKVAEELKQQVWYQFCLEQNI